MIDNFLVIIDHICEGRAAKEAEHYPPRPSRAILRGFRSRHAEAEGPISATARHAFCLGVDHFMHETLDMGDSEVIWMPRTAPIFAAHVTTTLRSQARVRTPSADHQGTQGCLGRERSEASSCSSSTRQLYNELRHSK